MRKLIYILLIIPFLGYGQDVKKITRSGVNNRRAASRINATITQSNGNVNSISDNEDSLAAHLDTLQILRDDVNIGVDTSAAQRVDINLNIDSITVHRTAINLNIDSLATQRVDVNINEVKHDSLKDGTGIVWVDSLKSRVLDYLPPHGGMTFADSATVIALSQNVWSKLTGPVTNVYTIIDADDITFAGDTMTIEIAGDYVIFMGLSFEGSPSDVFHVAIYINGVITPFEMHRKTSNNDTGNMHMNGYLDNLAIGDDISFYIRNTGDNDDATLVSSQVTIFMLHPR